MISGEWIKENRLKRGYTQRDLGHIIGLYEYEIARLEGRGEFSDVGLECRLCKAFGLPVPPDSRDTAEVSTGDAASDALYKDLREMILSLNTMGQFLMLVKAAELSGEPAYNKTGEFDAERTKGYLSLIYKEFLRLQQQDGDVSNDMLERLFRTPTE